jgi:hypothetical protein
VPSHLKQHTLDQRFSTLGASDTNNKYFEYYHRFRETPRSFVSQHEKDFEALKAALPVTDHPTDWGTIHDVEWTED